MSRQSSRKEQLTDKHAQNSNNDETGDLFNLLVVGGMTINHKQVGILNNESKKTIKNGRKASHKSLGVNLQIISQKSRFKVASSRHPTEAVKTNTKKITKQTQENEVLNSQQKQNLLNSRSRPKAKLSKLSKRVSKQEECQKQQEKQPAKTVEVENNFVEKKMKIGHRAKSDAMKQFIIETLMKGKMEGNSLTIHKGTAQCINSPRKQYNKSQVATNSKEKYSLVLVQQKSKSVVPQRKSFLPPLPPNQFKPQRAQSRNVSNVPSLPNNKKWVAMVRKMEKKQPQIQTEKREQRQSEQVIQQNIIEENVSDVHLPIPQEIQQ